MTYNIEIEHEEYCSNTSVPDPEDLWDRASTHTDHTIGDRFYITEDYADIFLEKEPNVGDVLYAVYVIYSTEDSFGHDSGYGIEWMAAYSNEQDAIDLMKKIELSDKNEEQGFSYIDHNGKNISMGYAPWQGYFESLDTVDYAQVRYAGKK